MMTDLELATQEPILQIRGEFVFGSQIIHVPAVQEQLLVFLF